MIYTHNLLCRVLAIVTLAALLLPQGVAGLSSLPSIDASSQASGVKLYITNRLSNEVSVLDTQSNTVAATIPIGYGPQGITIRQDGDRAYTADSDSDWVSVVDLTSNSVVKTIPAGDGPVIPAINNDGSRVYVASHLSNSVTVIDTSTNSVIATISDVRWWPWGIAVSPDGAHIAVTLYGSGTVSIFDTSTFSEVAEAPVGSNPEGVVYHPDGSKIYVANLSSSTVSVIDTGTYSVTQTIPVGDGPVQFDFNSNASRLYVANNWSASASEIDVGTGNVLRTFDVGAGPIDVEIVDQHLYVTNHDDNSVSVVDLNSGSSVETISGFSGPHSIVAATVPSFTAYLPMVFKPPPNLKDLITKVTVTLPQPLERAAGSFCTWGGCSVSPRLYHEPFVDDRTLVGWTDSSGNGHVSVISGDSIEGTCDFPAKSVRGLVAHNDGAFAVLLWNSDSKIIWLSKRSQNGNEIWTTNLNGDGTFPEFWLGDGRLAYGSGLYLAYFTVKSTSGHYGDQLTYVDDNGTIQEGGWGWGCSHSLAELVGYHPSLGQFVAVCSSDCYPGKGIFINNNHQVYEADGNCGGSVSAQLGQIAPGEESWKLLFNALDRPSYEGHGIALATIDENYQSSFTWLTNTDGAYERDPAIARLGSDGQAEQYLVGWVTTDDSVYWLGVINSEGNFLAGPDEVTSAGALWGNRDDSFHTRADGSISWVQGDPTSTELRLFHFDGSAYTP